MARKQLDVVLGEQRLPGTDNAKVTFAGMVWEPFESPALMAEGAWLVKGCVISRGEEVTKDGVRDVARVHVTSVVHVHADSAFVVEGV